MRSARTGSVGVNAQSPGTIPLATAAIGAFVWAWIVAFLLAGGSASVPVAPVSATDLMPPGLLETVREYRGSTRLIFILSTAASLATLAFLALYRGSFPGRNRPFPTAHPVAGGAILGAAVGTVLFLVAVPFGLWGWEVGTGAGVLTLSLGDWALDAVKALALSIPISAAAGAAAVFAWNRFGRLFWVAASVILGAFAILWLWLWPVLVSPVFNTVEPLPRGPFRADLERLADASGIQVEGVFVEDASRRTRAINAYVHGLGSSRRVVIQDTALTGLGRDEGRVLVAHELAHVESRDPERGLLFALLVIPPAAFAVQLLTAALLRRRGSSPGGPWIVFPLALGLAVASLLVSFPGAWLSRQIEERADLRALELSEDPVAAVALQRRLDRVNLRDPDPPAAWVAMFSTHPSSVDRVGLARAFRDDAGR